MTQTKALEPGEATASATPELIQGCLYCTQQCSDLLEQLSAGSYVQSSGDSSSIGAHVRHILDRFLCFFAGLSNGVVDYDARARDKSIETNLQAASFALVSVSRRIEAQELLDQIDKSLRVRESVYHQAPPVEAGSTVERELMGLISHSIHHLAIIGLLAKSLGYQLGQDFGKAPSTILYERH